MREYPVCLCSCGTGADGVKPRTVAFPQRPCCSGNVVFSGTSYGIAGLLMLAVTQAVPRGETKWNVWRWSPACWLYSGVNLATSERRWPACDDGADCWSGVLYRKSLPRFCVRGFFPTFLPVISYCASGCGCGDDAGADCLLIKQHNTGYYKITDHKLPEGIALTFRVPEGNKTSFDSLYAMDFAVSGMCCLPSFANRLQAGFATILLIIVDSVRVKGNEVVWFRQCRPKIYFS